MTEPQTRVGRPSPAEELMGVRIVDATTEHAMGVQHGPDIPTLTLGCIGVLADSVSGRPVLFSKRPTDHTSTVSLHLDLLRPFTSADKREIVATGEPRRFAGSWALSEFTIVGPESEVLATGSHRLLHYPRTNEPAQPSRDSGSSTRIRTASSSLQDLMGIHLVRDGEGVTEATFVPRREHANPWKVVHGGLHAALVDAVMSSAVSSLPRRREMTLMTLELNYCRPIPVDGAAVTCAATVVHHGRRVVVVDATVSDSDGKALTTARGTFGHVAG